MNENDSFLCGKLEHWKELDECLHVHFSRKAKEIPDKIAVVDGDGKSLTYKELDDKTDELSDFMQMTYKVKLDDPIGIYMNKNINFVISYIAILKAGCAYSPIDISYPEHLIRSLTKECPMKVILTDNVFEKGLPKHQTSFNFDLWDELLSSEKVPFERNIPEPYNLAYLIFSSGSTGVPKAINCPHIGSLASYFWRIKNYPYTEDDQREGCNIFFTWELLRPLLGGATLYVIPQTTIYDPFMFCKFVEKNKLSRFLLTPSTLQNIFDLYSVNEEREKDLIRQWASVKTVILCGEVVLTSMVSYFQKVFPEKKLLNLYSVSECHDVTCHDLATVSKEELSKKKVATTGSVMTNVCFYILNPETMKVVPKGEIGGLYVGGITLAREYTGGDRGVNLTKERFIKNEHFETCFDGKTPETTFPDFIKDKRLYMTGDYAKIDENNELIITGRYDSMVKVRGYSVVLPAVETALNKFPKIQTSVVLKDDKERLVAYIVPSQDIEEEISGFKVRQFLEKELPHYMLPNVLMKLEALPISGLGKLDKKNLPTPENSPQLVIPLKTSKTVRAPENAIEKDLLEKCWKVVFDEDEISTEDDFFFLGGTSLTLSKLFFNVQETFFKLKPEYQTKQLKLTSFYKYKTIQSQALLIQKILCSKPLQQQQRVKKKAILSKQRNENETKSTYMKDILLSEEEKKLVLESESEFSSVSYYYEKSKEGMNILLTGATGFLGAFLLSKLLDFFPNSVIYCLMRYSEDYENPQARIINNLVRNRLIKEENIDNPSSLFDKRIRIVRGDFSKINFGMKDEEYFELDQKIDFVIHNGAEVNFMKSYDQLYNTNVQSVKEFTKFCLSLKKPSTSSKIQKQNRKVKLFSFVSTDGVFDLDEEGEKKEELMEENLYDSIESFTTGYCQSKIVAERHLREYKLLLKDKFPLMIFRPGDLFGDMKNGCYNPAHDFVHLLESTIKMNVGPLDYSFRDVTPVDLCANFIAEKLNSIKGKDIANEKKIEFNLVNPNLVRIIDLLRILKSDLGYETMKFVSKMSWMRRVKNDGPTNPFFPLFPIYNTGPVNDNNFYKIESSLKMPAEEKYNLGTLVFKKMVKRLVEDDKVFGKVSVITQLYNRVAIVTGSSVGIGLAIARYLCKNGVTTIISSRRKDVLEQVKERWSSTEKLHYLGKIDFFVADVTNKESVDEMVAYVKNKYGRIDYFVNNAGVMPATMMKNCDVDMWNKCVDVNVRGVLHGCGAVLKEFEKNKSGHVINISSNAGRDVWETLVVYSASKFFVEAMTKGIRMEMGKFNVKVTSIQPGDVGDTEIMEKKKQKDDEGVKVLEGLFATQMLKTRDIGKAVLFAVQQPLYCGINEILIEPLM